MQRFVTRPADVIVVGAGIVGAFCARALADAGLRVVVVDARPPGGGATAACMGHVVVMDDSEAQFALCRRSQRLWDALDEEMPESVERDVCGTLWIAEDNEQMDAVLCKHAFYGERGVDTEILDAALLAEAEPELRAGLAGALRVPGDSVVYPPAAVAWLLRMTPEITTEIGTSVGTEIGTAVESVDATADGATVGLADGRVLSADRVVIAAGLASLDLLAEPLREALPAARIRPRKGHLVITDRAPGFCHHQLVELGYLASAHGALSAGASAPSVAFNLQPRATGQMLVGSSRQLGTTSPAVEPGVVHRMLERARAFLPRLGRLQAIRVWTGFRPSTDDHLPYVGPIPGADHVVLAAGHEGLGITTAPGTAELVAHHVAGAPTGLDAAAFRPDRAPLH